MLKKNTSDNVQDWPLFQLPFNNTVSLHKNTLIYVDILMYTKQFTSVISN